MKRDKDCPYKKHCGEWDNCADCDYHEAFEALRRKITYHKNRVRRLLLDLAKYESPGPLTLEELRQMDGEPVWIKADHYGVYADVVHIIGKDEGEARVRFKINWHLQENGYNKTWLAFLHKPKEG